MSYIPFLYFRVRVCQYEQCTQSLHPGLLQRERIVDDVSAVPGGVHVSRYHGNAYQVQRR